MILVDSGSTAARAPGARAAPGAPFCSTLRARAPMAVGPSGQAGTAPVHRQSTVPAPGRSVGYHPGRGGLGGTAPVLQTGREPPPALPRVTTNHQPPLREAVPPDNRPGLRTADLPELRMPGRPTDPAKIAGPVTGWPGWVSGRGLLGINLCLFSPIYWTIARGTPPLSPQ